MIKFFGFTKKKRITIDKLSSKYVADLDDVIEKSFSDIVEFINESNKFKVSPNININDSSWLKLIVFSANNFLIKNHFSENKTEKIHNIVFDLQSQLINKDQEVGTSRLTDNINFFNQKFEEIGVIERTMAVCIFEKCSLNKFQDKLFKQKNDPNPIFIKELSNYLKLFLFNWEDVISNYKIES